VDRQTLNKYLSIAEEAAISAGKYLLGYKKDDILIESQQGRDVKISVDRESEEIIIDILRAKTDLAILSEEKGFKEGDAKNSTLKWVVDPLDGSFNFLRGIPNYCVSIGLCHEDKPVLGAIYDFNRQELFTGIAEAGAWLNGSVITVSETNAEHEAVLLTGFPVNTDFSLDALRNYMKQIQNFKKIRLIGSAALSLAYVAAGRADAYFERGIMFWDVAAGLAIVSGAGGEYFIKETPKSNAYNAYANNSFLKRIFGK